MPWPRASCSLFVLAGLGVLGLALPQAGSAQAPGGVLPARALPVLRGVVSGNAVVSAPAPGAARSLLTIDQSSPRAIIDWRSFNIGSGSEVLFRQPGSTASTLNRIYDANPSVIQGRLTANGQVLLINQNGILFDRGTQVNVQSLVASTLNLRNERFLSGALSGGGLSAPAFAGGYDDTGATRPARPDGSRPGNITIGKGGDAAAAASSILASAGGSVLLFAPAIDNNGGIIKSPDGQVILAAGSKVYLALNEDANDVTLRGLVVEVAAEQGGPSLNLTNLIRNAGEISADRGNVSLAALAVNQEGRISAKAAVQSNGSIYLTARARTETGDEVPAASRVYKAGSVNFAAGSVTEVVPDVLDKATVPDAQSYVPYRGVITATGRTIESAGLVRVPGGRISLNASDTVDSTGARVYLGAGSVTSVAGVWADVDVAKNLQTFRVTSNELKNSPDQRNGILRGATVTVDLRQDNNILELGGYRDIVARTVAEKAAAGGELQIGSTGAVIQRSGAEIDASGGGYRFGSGTVATTRLLGSDGRIYDIATAPAQQPYAQLLDRYERVDARWGQTLSMANPLGSVGEFQSASVQGLSGGLVSVTSGAGLVLDGTLKGGVTLDPRQFPGAPQGGTLRIGEFLPGPRTFAASQRIGSLTWRQQSSDTLGANFEPTTVLTPAQRDSVTLAAGQVFGPADSATGGLGSTAFSIVELNVNGRIVVPSDVDIASDVGGSLTLRSPQIDIAGDIRLPAGSLTVRPVIPTSAPISADLATNPERVIVRSGAHLSTAGAWINRSAPDGSFIGEPAPSSRLNPDSSIGARSIDGGAITVQIDDVNFQTRLERGASLDVGGGASIDRAKRVTGGKGGTLSIANGTANQSTSDWLQADLRGFAIASGGELNLTLARAVIDSDDANGLLPAATTRLGAGLFANQGFAKVSVAATDGIAIAPGTAIQVEQLNLLVDPVVAAGLESGAGLDAIATVARLPDFQRSAASVVLNARGGGQPGAATLTLGNGADIRTDPRGEVTLSAVNGLWLDGRISAPGGRVTLTLNGPTTTLASDLRIGSAADISTAGAFVATPNDRGLVQGILNGGGLVTIEARNTGVNFQAGARIDVSGVNQTVDVAAGGAQPGFLRRTLNGHAGTVIVRSQGQTVLDGAFIGQGGATAAAGGSFALDLRRPDGQTRLPAERRIVVTPDRNRVPTEPGLVDATINVDELRARGFEKLRLQSENRIEFRGSSTLDFERGIRLDAPLIDLEGATNVVLRASSVALGQSLGERQRVVGGDVPIWQINEGTASPVLATRLGTGSLRVSGGSVDLFGSLTLNGAARVGIDSGSDIRLIGRSVNFTSTTGGQAVSRQIGSLTTAGDLDLTAAQIYPATRSEYSIAIKGRPPGTSTDSAAIRISSSGAVPGTAYSAGGKVTLEAPTITQGGTLKAPLGELEFRATKLLEFTADSLTSVSGAGLTVPYGTTQAGVLWRYAEGSSPASSLNAVTVEGKRITLNSPSVDVGPDAKIDLRGGGDILAVEFVPGNGGDSDITLRDNTFAIIPTARLAAMPYDRHLQSLKDPGFGFLLDNGRDSALYDSVQIGPGGAVPAGTYTLLPARYALLPDAMLVELQTGAAYRNLQSGQTTTLPNGDVVLAGFRSARGTSVRESQSVGVVLSPGSAVRQASDYNLNGASFFASAAALERQALPRAPSDAGRLGIQNTGVLALGGSFETAAGRAADGSIGRRAEVDIGGSRIAVVDRVGDASVAEGYLQIEGTSLSRLNGSVLLGGRRSDTESGVRITTSASDVLVANSSAGAVDLPELILAASQSIEIRSGSVLSASGQAGSNQPTVLTAEPTGALVRLSTGGQARVERGSAGTASGDVRIAAGANVSAASSLLIDATRSTESLGQLRVGGTGGVGGSLSLSSGQVSLGDTASALVAPRGLVLSNEDLAALSALDELVLRGYGGIDLLGTATVGSGNLTRLTLDTPLLRGRASTNAPSQQATITARTLELSNNTGAEFVTESGTGTLTLKAERLVLGAGAKAVTGFGDVRMLAGNAVVSAGAGTLRVAAPLVIETPRVLALGGSVQTLSAVDTAQPGAPVYSPLTLAGSSTPVVDANPGEIELGGRITLEGRNVSVATTVQARSGQVVVAAHGAGINDGVSLDRGALLDARGQAKSFNGTLAGADGGSAVLTSVTGPIAVRAGARVDVSSAAEGGGAGRLAVSGASLTLGGELAGHAGMDERSGSANLDLGALNSFSELNTTLNAGGFALERQLRLRGGNIEVAAADHVQARRVALIADSGGINVAGTLGTSAAVGGARIELFASGDINLASGSRVVANGSNAGARGGEVRIASASGALVFDADSIIDVRAGNAGPAGSVTFGVGRDETSTTGSTRLEGTVRRWSGAALAARAAGGAGTGSDAPASVDLEATRRYSVGASIESADIDGFASDHAAFVATAGTPAATSARMGALRDETGSLGGGRVLGATELRRDGDLSLAAAWDLTTEPWLAGSQAGTLTVRASGNLIVAEAIGSPGDGILGTETWNLRLSAGADLASADSLATLTRGALGSDQGTLRLSGALAKLRTGTGRIDLRAGQDVVINDPAAVIYTAGRMGAPDTNPDGRDRWAIDGGGISIRAGGSVAGALGPAGELWINEWMRRPREASSQFASLQSTDWWSLRPRFQQGVATLAGGDIEVDAGSHINNLAVVLPTSGRTYRDGDGKRQVDVQGGGDLSVRSGGDLIGSSFLVARGQGRVDAAGNVGTGRRTQLYLMGASSGVVPEGAQLDLVAGGTVSLQSINNPTAMAVTNVEFNFDDENAVFDPSLGTGGNFSTFFTYSANSRVRALAKSGDLSYAAVLNPRWRTLNAETPINSLQTDIPAAFPASLSFVAFDGNLSGPRRLDAITTFPSSQASVRMLAGESLLSVGLYGSDRDPASVITPTTSFARANDFISGQIDGRAGLRPVAGQGRLVEREGTDPYVFELQALKGSLLTDGTASNIVLAAPSRVRAGVDIVGTRLLLQNLKPDDVTEVRADTGDIRNPQAVEIGGPGRLLLQAGRNIDLGAASAQGATGNIGGLVATGNTANSRLLYDESARVTLVAGVPGAINLSKLDGAYGEVVALNTASGDIIDLYRQLGTEPDPAAVLGASSVASLAARDSAYARFVSIDQKAPRAFAAYRDALRADKLPLGATSDSAAAVALYRLLNGEPDLTRLQTAGSVAALVAAAGGEAYRAFVALDQRYPLVFSDYVQRRANGALPTGVTPIVFSNALSAVVAEVVAPIAAARGDIFSFQTSIQTYGGSDIDLWAPGGDIVVGLTTPGSRTVGVLTNAGGAIRSVLSGDFNINQGKVITAQGGDILLLSSQGSIDAGRGAKTSLSTPPPTRMPVFETVNGQQVQVGVLISVPASATGSGIQTLSSDPDGLGPRIAPRAGDVYLFAPAGTIDAGEAGIRSSGNIVIAAQTVLNASNISASGASAGVPVAASGSLASSVATAGGNTTAGSKAAEEASNAATNAAKAAASAVVAKPNILTVEVLGFGEKNCKEQDKDCFAK